MAILIYVLTDSKSVHLVHNVTIDTKPNVTIAVWCRYQTTYEHNNQQTHGCYKEALSDSEKNE